MATITVMDERDAAPTAVWRPLHMGAANACVPASAPKSRSATSFIDCRCGVFGWWRASGPVSAESGGFSFVAD